MILDLGTIDYEDALKIQHGLVNQRRLGIISDSILILEHPPVFTIGRSGSRENLLADESALIQKGIKVIDADRGGDITFHGPGQIVSYPILDLKNRSMDLHRYLRDLEEVAISFLKIYGVRGSRKKEATGVWVDESKIVSIGIAAKDWITYHGLSVNVNVDTGFFSMINPCGFKDLKVTSLKDILSRRLPMREAKDKLLDELKNMFGPKIMESANECCSALA